MATRQSANYDMVTRRSRPLTGSEREGFEHLRDALNLESKLRIDPPGKWTLEKTGRKRPRARYETERTWTGYGREVQLTKAGRLGDWTLTVNGTRVLTDVSRRVAFETAADRMESISEQAGEEV